MLLLIALTTVGAWILLLENFHCLYDFSLSVFATSNGSLVGEHFGFEVLIFFYST